MFLVAASVLSSRHISLDGHKAIRTSALIRVCVFLKAERAAAADEESAEISGEKVVDSGRR